MARTADASSTPDGDDANTTSSSGQGATGRAASGPGQTGASVERRGSVGGAVLVSQNKLSTEQMAAAAAVAAASVTNGEDELARRKMEMRRAKELLRELQGYIDTINGGDQAQADTAEVALIKRITNGEDKEFIAAKKVSYLFAQHSHMLPSNLLIDYILC